MVCRCKSYLIAILFLFPFFLWAGNNSEIIRLIPGQIIYPLQYRFVSIDSVSLYGIQPELRWTTDAARGRLILLNSVSDSIDAEIYYRYADQSVPIEVNLGIRSGQPENKEIRDKNALKQDLQTIPESNINAKGSILRSIQVAGNAGNDIQSDMNLQISGELAEGIEISGTVSDRNADSYDNVSSSDLKEIDNIYIEVQGPKSSLYFGDITAEGRYSRLNPYRRKLMGISGSLEGETLRINTFAGAARGKFRRQRIVCSDGNQGPYSLRGESVNSSIFIVPGSERVFLDGILLSPDNYTLYYRDAEVIISPALMLSSESRLVVEFSYQDQLYSRSSLGAEGEFRRGKLRVKLGSFQEKDDPEDPADPTLSRILQEDPGQLIGEESSIIALNAAIPDSSGDYILADSIYIYAGPGEGNHSVYFYREEDSGGYARQYDENGLAYYQYAPSDPASYFWPRRWIEPAEQLNTTNVGISWQINENSHLSIEQLFSSSRDNLFSSGKADRSGMGTLQMQYSPFINEKIFTLEVDRRVIGRDLKTFEAIYNPDLERQTGLVNSSQLSDMARYRLSSESSFYSIRLGANSYKSYSEKDRSRLFTELNWKQSLPIAVNYSRLYAGKFLPHYDLAVKMTLVQKRELSLTASYSDEFHKAVFNGLIPERRRQITQSMGFGKKFSLSHSYLEDYEEKTGEFSVASRKNDIKMHVEQLGNEQVRYSGLINFRRDRRKSGRSDYFMGRNRLQLRLAERGISMQYDDQLNRSSDNLREAVYYYVGEGQGAYSWDSRYHEYVPDDLGSHILRYELSPEKRDEVLHSNEAKFELKRTVNLPIAMHLQWQNRLHTEFRADKAIFYRELQMEKVDDDLYSGRMRYRQDLRLQSINRKRSIDISYDANREQNTRNLQLQQLASRSELSLRYRFEYGEGLYGILIEEENIFRRKLQLSDYRILSEKKKIAISAVFRLSRQLKLNCEYQYSNIFTEFDFDFKTDINTFKLSGRYSGRQGEVLQAGADLSSVKSAYSKALPYEAANGLDKGLNRHIRLQYRKQLSKTLSTSLQLQHRLRGNRQALNIARIEIKAWF